jgi:2-iminoacetate synthase
VNQSFIDEAKIAYLLDEAQAPSPVRLSEILDKARAAQGLDQAEVATLLQVSDPQQLEQLFAAAKAVKQRIYGKRVVLFAPLYLSNECVNNCVYCGFRRDNSDLPRRTLTRDEIREQVEILLEMGHKRLLLESGEHEGKTPISYILQAIETVYATRLNRDNIRRVNINVAATSVDNYRLLKQAGIGTYQLFQETYHRASYQRLHPPGPKADYDYHLSAMDRAMQGGIDDVGIGALFGLYDHRFEVLALLQHAQHLQQKYGVGPHTISVPRWRPAPGASLPGTYQVKDWEFQRLVAILRLAVPYTGIIMSTRESPAMRDALLDLGVSQLSAASAVAPGGYSREPEEEPIQFELSDHRSLQEVVLSIARHGYLPSFCTGCYRVGRTGERFMSLARDGSIQTYCQPNAILTFAEYLLDHADAAPRQELQPRFTEWLHEIHDPMLRQATEERLEGLKAGHRDYYF